MSRADLAHAVRHASNGQVKATERGIRGWEKGEYTPRGEAMPAIAAALDCGISDLYETVSDSDDAEAARVPSGPLTRDERELLVDLMGRLGTPLTLAEIEEARR